MCGSSYKPPPNDFYRQQMANALMGRSPPQPRNGLAELLLNPMPRLPKTEWVSGYWRHTGNVFSPVGGCRDIGALCRSGRGDMAKAKPTRTAYRSAVDGQFTTKKEAERKPREHVKERVPVPSKRKRK